MRILIALFFLTLPVASYATDWNIPSDRLGKALPKGCDASTDASLYDCAAKAYQHADADLNEVWKKVLASINPTNPDAPAGLSADQIEEWKTDLIAAQKAWVAFKDTDCNQVRSFEYWGGSARNLAVLSCQYEYTIARTEDLQQRYLGQ